MQINLIRLKTILKDKRYIWLISFVALNLILLGVVIFLGIKISTAYTEYNDKKITVENLKSQVDLTNRNKKILSGNLDKYNTVLENLIPDNETYFQVIAALEKLQRDTGVVVNNYSINLKSTSEDKLTLTLSVSGNRENIEQLFKNHLFISGRLITNETTNFDLAQEEQVYEVSLYHDTNPKQSDNSEVTITQADLKLIDQAF